MFNFFKKVIALPGKVDKKFVCNGILLPHEEYKIDEIDFNNQKCFKPSFMKKNFTNNITTRIEDAGKLCWMHWERIQNK